MKVKPGAKILFVVLIAAVGFLVVRNKMAKSKATVEPATTVSNTDTLTIKGDTVLANGATIVKDAQAPKVDENTTFVSGAKTETVPAKATTSAAPTKAKVVKSTTPKVTPKEVRKAPVKTKKTGERENLELAN